MVSSKQERNELFKRKREKGKTQIGTKRDFRFLRVVLYIIVVSFVFLSFLLLTIRYYYFLLCFKTQNRIIKKERKEERKWTKKNTKRGTRENKNEGGKKKGGLGIDDIEKKKRGGDFDLILVFVSKQKINGNFVLFC